jgi:hypothetical protein
MSEQRFVKLVGPSTRPAKRGSLRAPFDLARFARESNGGGGGSRTRVREYLPVGLYMRIRFCFLMPGVRKRLKTARHQSR